MDVTFTNVLEGARQYFQGLPAATNSAAGPSCAGASYGSVLCNQSHSEESTNLVGSVTSATAASPQVTTSRQTGSDISYWPPVSQDDEAKDASAASPQGSNAQQQQYSAEAYSKPVSQQSKYLPSYGQQNGNDTSKVQLHNYQYHQQAHLSMTQQSNTSQPYQLKRLHHLHETPSSVLQYSSHYSSTTHQPLNAQIGGSHQSTSSHSPSLHCDIMTSMQTTRSPSRPQLATSPKSTSSFHQLQSNVYGYQRQSSPYYLLQSQASNATSNGHDYQQQPAPPCNQQQQQHASQSYPTHSQSPVQTQTQYLSTKMAWHANYDGKQENISAPVTKQVPPATHQRTTHNLPPIAALSSVNYHSSSGKRLVNNKHKVVQPLLNHINLTPAPPPCSVNSSSMAMLSTTNYSMAQRFPNVPNQYSQQVSNNHQVNGLAYQYVPSSSSNYTSDNNSSHTSPAYQSSYCQYQKSYGGSNRMIYDQSTNKPVADNFSTLRSTIIAKQKKESPLDLSVKTVRTSADSTALDDVESSEVRKFNAYASVRCMPPPMHTTPSGTYPTYDLHITKKMHANKTTSLQSTGAPKVDFLPNFNVSVQNSDFNRRSLKQAQINKNHMFYTPENCSYQNNALTDANAVNSHAHQSKRTEKELPRIELPVSGCESKRIALNAIPEGESQRKRPSNLISSLPKKILKVETWKETIDQQIEQKFSSYTNSKLQQEQQRNVINQEKNNINGNTFISNNQRQNYTSYFQKTQHTYHPHQSYNHQSVNYNNQAYEASPVDQYHCHLDELVKNPPPLPNEFHPNCASNANNPNNNTIGSAADKRVLSLLRNSLEVKGAKQAQQKKMVNDMSANHMRSGIQQPKTDVMAPLQPKSDMIGRHNISPFTAANILERNSNTPLKFHFPRAVDSIRIETDITSKDGCITDTATSSALSNVAIEHGDLDGLAAFLAARIRTKAELKQVGSTQGHMQNTYDVQSESKTNSSAPPKLTQEKSTLLPRRRLFSRSDEEHATVVTLPSSSSLPPRNTTLRSSSETSVFDFRDSDSEGEMPILERQSLEDMRRDRKHLSHKKEQPTAIAATEVLVESTKQEETDPFWSNTCDSFIEQLQNNCPKKRGRKKKTTEPEVLTPKERCLGNEDVPVLVKEEFNFKKDVEDANIDVKSEIKMELNDSDVPPVEMKESSIKSEVLDNNGYANNEDGAKTKLEYSSDSSDSDNETIQTVSRKLLFKFKSAKDDSESNKMILRSADSTPKKSVNKITKKKTVFGDGSDFYPGWEEEVYKYKQSLRMPANLINITRPPHWHRLSTSLPDLDPCSPAASSLTDDSEFTIMQRSVPNHLVEALSTGKHKQELLDSDIDSNSSFSVNFSKRHCDFEETSCTSVKSSIRKLNDTFKIKENNNSIINVLVERCGKFNNIKTKIKEKKKSPKIIPKSNDLHELLPTPSLGIGCTATPKGKVKNKNSSKDLNKVDMNYSVYLGFFRKKTVNNFKDSFKKNTGFMGMDEPFSTVVLKSRTRTETRVLKQRATIREVFGEERPASAPPMTSHEDKHVDSKQKKSFNKREVRNITKIKENTKCTKGKEKKTSIRAGLRSASGIKNENVYVKTLRRGKKHIKNYEKVVISKRKIKDEPLENISFKNISLKKFESKPEKIAKAEVELNKIGNKNETFSIDGGNAAGMNNVLQTRKRLKLRNIRRKFSSGFDYIRKKKKQIKNNRRDVDTNLKFKRRGITPRSSNESVQDIQKEIKTWVMNKGVGETHLHRAARLGYTDVTAYCLEKLDHNPSPKDNAGYTPLHEACSRGHIEIARLLLQYGANVSESAQGGVRPLHDAVENGFVEIIRLLLSYGADPMLATYSGNTPLSITNDEDTKRMLNYYMADVHGQSAPYWTFNGPATCFDPKENGYDPLEGAPSPEPVAEDEDIEIEMSEQPLPNLYTLEGELPHDRWILLQDLSVLLKIKSRDTLLKQINPDASSSGTSSHKNVLRELKFVDFMEQARCCQLLCANEKLNVRSSKVALIKYTDKVKQLLGVERIVLTSR